MKVLFGLAMAAAVTVPALAAPVPFPDHGRSGSIILAEGGCGPEGHRGYDGYCRSNGPRYYEPPRYYNPGVRWECPPGWHFGGGRCWPN
jgi:hypothetical protein